MCANFHPNPTTFRVKRLARKNWSNEKAQFSWDARTFLLPMTEYRVKGSLGSWDSACSLVSYLHYVSAKLQPNRTTFRVKGLAPKEVVKRKSTKFTRCSTYSASNDKISGQKELKKLNLCMYLINYFHYVCAKLHPNPTFLRVKGLARQKLVKPKSKNFTRCSTYSASNPKILSHGERRKLTLAFSLVTYLHYVCANFHPNRTTFSVKGLPRRKVAKPKSTNFKKCSTYTASNQKILSQGECRNLRLCM